MIRAIATAASCVLLALILISATGIACGIGDDDCDENLGIASVRVTSNHTSRRPVRAWRSTQANSSVANGIVTLPPVNTVLYQELASTTALDTQPAVSPLRT